MAGEKVPVLYVEDDPDIQFIGRWALEHIGRFSVCACSNAPAALEAIHHFAPQLIVLDVKMPGMSGVELAAYLRARPNLATVPLVFMTAELQLDDIDGYHRLGARAVIPKPFDPLTLAERLQALL